MFRPALGSSGVLLGLALLSGFATAESAAPRIVVEKPYRLGERPRADGAVVASVADEDVAKWNVGGNGDPGYPSNRSAFHVAPRVVVDAEVHAGKLPLRAEGRGTLSQTALVAQSRQRGYWPFRLCYEEALRHDGKLRGKTRLRVRIGRDGRVTASKPLGSELRSDEVPKCLAARARSFRLIPGPRKAIDVNLTVDLNPGDAPLPDGEPLDAGTKTEAETGSIDLVNAEAVLAEASSRVAECYASAVTDDPRLWGRISFYVSMNSDGTVRDARQYDSRFPTSRVVDCARAAVQAARFSAPPAGRGGFVWAVRLGNPPESGAGVASAAVSGPARAESATSSVQSMATTSPSP